MKILHRKCERFNGNFPEIFVKFFGIFRKFYACKSDVGRETPFFFKSEFRHPVFNVTSGFFQPRRNFQSYPQNARNFPSESTDALQLRLKWLKLNLCELLFNFFEPAIITGP
jgi:hypothetical protein